MYNRDQVIRQIAIAIENHAEGVGRAFGEWLASGCRGREQEVLRAELVALWSGFESTAHDGSTYEARRSAARGALGAWDGVEHGMLSDQLGVRGSAEAWRVLGVTVYSTGEVAHVPPEVQELVLLGVEASGVRGEAALVWAIGEKRRRLEVDRQLSAENQLANSLRAIADALGIESAETLVGRLPDRLRRYAEAVLKNRG